MHPAQLRVLPYARSAPGLDKARSQTPVLALVPGGGGRAWPGFETTRRAKLAARTASGRAAAPGRQHADKQENTSSTDGERSARSAADGKRAARSAGFETTRRAKLTARTPSRRAKPTARGADAERAGRAGSSRHGRRAGGPSQRPAARTPSGRAERAAHGADGERAGRRPQAPTRRTRAYNEAGTRRAKQRRGPRPRETVRPGGPP